MDKQIILKRLSLIKYLCSKAIEQTYQNEIVAGFSVLYFHDCVEMFLDLVRQELNLQEEKSLMQYWTKIPALTMRGSIERMKNARVQLKHHSQFPSKTDIEEFRITVKTFLQNNTSTFFGSYGIDYDTVSLSDLVHFAQTKEYLKKSEEELMKEDYYECLKYSAYAFTTLIDEYEFGKSEYLDSIFDIGTEINRDYQKLTTSDSEGANWFKRVTETTNKMRDVLKMMSYGVDYKRYLYFKMITPQVYKYASSKKYGVEFECMPKEYFVKSAIMTEKTCQDSINFVIDTALEFQDFNFQLNEIRKGERYEFGRKNPLVHADN